MNNKIPPFYIAKTLLGFGPDKDLNRVDLHLPDGQYFTLCEMNEDRTEQDIKRWRSLVKILNVMWEDS